MRSLQLLRPDDEAPETTPAATTPPVPLPRPDPVHVALCGVTDAEIVATQRVLNALRAAVDAELCDDLLLHARGADETAAAHAARVRPLHQHADHRHAALHLCDHLLYRYRGKMLRRDRERAPQPRPVGGAS